MNIKVGDVVKFAIHAIAYQAVKSDVVSSLLSRITSAGVKEKLAEKVLADVIGLAPGYFEDTGSKMLGARTPEIVSLSSSLFFSNTREQTRQGIGDLVTLIAASKGQGEFVQKLAREIIPRLTHTGQLQDNTVQRILHALGQEKGGENILRMTVENILSGFTGWSGKVIKSTVMSVLKHAILDNEKYKDKDSTTWTHQVAAWETHNYLLQSLQAQKETKAGISPKIAASLDNHVLPAAPTGWQAIKTTAAIGGDIVNITGATGFASTTWDTVDFIGEALGIKSQPSQPAEKVFTDAWGSDIAVHANMPLQEFAAMVVKANTLDSKAMLKHKETMKKGNFTPTYGSALTLAIEALPEKARVYFTEQRKQIDAFYQRWKGADIKVGLTWAGGLASVAANHAKSYPVTHEVLDITRPVTKEPEKVGNYLVDNSFLSRFKEGLNLTVNDSQRATGLSAKAAGWGSWAFSAVEKHIPGSVASPLDAFNGTQQQQLKQLLQIAGGDPLRMQALTAYLNPDHLLATNPLSAFAQKGADVICADNLWMKLDKPETSFTVSRDENNNVTIQAQFKWPVLASGKSAETLQPVSNQTGSVTMNTTMQFLQDGVMKEKMDSANTGLQVELQEKLMFEWSENPPSAPPTAPKQNGESIEFD